MKKKCSKCKIKKDVSMFWKNNTTSTGLQAYCMLCHNVQKATWINNNPEAYKAQQKSRKKRGIKHANDSKLRSRISRKEMSDGYIRSLMTMKSDLKSKDIPDELVEIHRLNLKLKRALELTPKLKPPT